MKTQMIKIKKKNVIIILAIISGFLLLQFAPMVKAAASDGGTTIYDSTYIDQMETKLKQMIQDSNKDLKKQVEEYEKELADLKDSMVFKIIKLPKGKILIGEASTEIIVRNKNRVKAYVEAEATGGVSNLISGKDLKNGEMIPNDQLLLIPKADGRGLTALEDADIMIKGLYTIK